MTQDNNLIPLVDVTETDSLEEFLAASRAQVLEILETGHPYLMVSLLPTEEGTRHQPIRMVATCADEHMLSLCAVTLGLLGTSRMDPAMIAAVPPAQAQATAQLIGMQLLTNYVQEMAKAQLDQRSPASDAGATEH